MNPDLSDDIREFIDAKVAAERTAMAHAIHDDPLQSLLACTMMAERLATRAEAGSLDMSQVQETASLLENTLRETAQKIRSIITKADIDE